MSSAYIVAAVRTPGGRKGGRLAGWHPVDLGAYVLNTLVERAGTDPGMVEDVIFGCVGQAGEQSTNIARNVVLASKLPQDVPGTSVDRQCGSSQQALQFAAQAVMSATMDIVVAGGVESMTRVPMGLPHSLPEQHGFGSYMSSGIDERFPGGIFNQFAGAERLAEKYDLSKDELDEFALRSHRLAAEASGTGAFTSELVPVPISAADGTAQWHSRDEGIRLDASLASIRAVKLLQPGGRLTAATSSQMCDGASAILVANEKGLKTLGVDPMARIHHFSVLGHDPRIMLEAPIPATARALARSGLKIDDIDLFEVNEAFASVPLSWLKATGADPERMNVLGGAIALGHPLGATGTRLMSTLVHALRCQSKRYGLQTMCEGGGMANVMIVERM